MKVEGFFKFNMSRIFISVFTFSILIASQNVFAEKMEAHEPSEVVFNLDTTKYFTHYREQLKHFAEDFNPNSDNEFCIIGYYDTKKTDDDFLYRTNIYWKQGNKILFWSGGDDENDISNSVKIVDLLSDIPKKKEEYKYKTAPYTQKWASDVIKDCYKNGHVVRFSSKELLEKKNLK
jgi:hypothetical protein